MATKTFLWNDGSGDEITLTYTGTAGDSTPELSSDENAGLDRSKTLVFKTVDGTAIQGVVVSQPGLREEFTTSDSWGPSNGLYAVLKQ